MRFIKMLSLAILTAIALIVFANPFSTSSQAEGEEDDEIVLCKKGSTKLCPPTELWGPRKEVYTYPETVTTFLGMLETKCSTDRLRGPIRPIMAPVLEWNMEKAIMKECSGACKQVKIEGLPQARISVDAGDQYLLLLPLTLKFSECIFSLTCTYTADLVLPIADPNTGGFPQAVAEGNVMNYSAGSAFCPKTIKLDTRLVMFGKSLTVLLSLFDLTTEEQELQPAEEEHEEELHGEEWHKEILEFEKEEEGL